jgi:hypothetical protein
LPFNEQQHNPYGVVDFKIGRFDVNAGVGYGLTPGSHRLDVQDDHRNGSERGRVRQIERGKQDASQTEISSDQLFPPLVAYPSELR